MLSQKQVGRLLSPQGGVHAHMQNFRRLSKGRSPPDCLAPGDRHRICQPQLAACGRWEASFVAPSHPGMPQRSPSRLTSCWKPVQSSSCRKSRHANACLPLLGVLVLAPSATPQLLRRQPLAARFPPPRRFREPFTTPTATATATAMPLQAPTQVLLAVQRSILPSRLTGSCAKHDHTVPSCPFPYCCH